MDIISKDVVIKTIQKRPLNAHKGSMGTLFSICGSYGMAGAAILSGKAALKSGLGLLKCAVPKSIYPICGSALFESIFVPLSENEQGTINKSDFNIIIDNCNKADAVLVGCGLGVNNDTIHNVFRIIEQSESPVIIDADGINCLQGHIDVLSKAKSKIILTPHPGEMGRLTLKSASKVNNSREETAVKFAQKNNVIVVLKGAGTIVADADGRVMINHTGNPGMATGGSGDVLSGIIASLIAQGCDAFDACCSGVYLHGLAGDIAANKLGQISMLPSDLIESLHEAFSMSLD